MFQTYFIVSCTHLKYCKYSNNGSLLQCYSIVKIQFKNFYLTIFMALNTNMMNKTINTFTLTIKSTVKILKNILVLKRLKWRITVKQNIIEENRAN